MMVIVFDWIWKNLFMNWCSFWAPSFFYNVPEISIREHSLKAKHAKGHTLLNYDMRREKRGKQIPWKEDKNFGCLPTLTNLYFLLIERRKKAGG